MTYFRKAINNNFFTRSSIFLLLFCFYSCTPDNQTKEYTFHGQTMGTVFNIKFISKKLSDEIVSNLKTQIDSALININQQMSTYIEDSEISRFNNLNDTTDFQVSAEFATVIEEALKIYKLSSGSFDITVNPLVKLWGFGSTNHEFYIPSEDEITYALHKVGSNHIKLITDKIIKKEIPELEIDLSSIAKGYGVDVVSFVFDKYQINNYMVEIGGEVFARGLNFENENWKIGIDKPFYQAFPGKDLQNILSISNVGVATSGDYRNFFEYEGNIYSHTINPKTGKPVTHNLASVTIIAPNCMQADALATATLVKGKEKGLKFLQTIPNVEGYFISREGKDQFNTAFTTGFKKYMKGIKN